VVNSAGRVRIKQRALRISKTSPEDFKFGRGWWSRRMEEGGSGREKEHGRFGVDIAKMTEVD
jgi:hypothetical protein